MRKRMLILALASGLIIVPVAKMAAVPFNSYASLATPSNATPSNAAEDDEEEGDVDLIDDILDKKAENIKDEEIAEYGLATTSDISLLSMEESDWEYSVNYDGTITITKYTGTDLDIVIPSEIDGYIVSSIGSSVGFSSSGITSVVIPGNITTEWWTFSNCKNLHTVTFEGSIEKISIGMFADCPSLETVILPDGLKIIEKHAFEDCENLTSITLPDTVEEIGENAFIGTGIVELHLPSSVSEFKTLLGKDASAITVDENNPYFKSVDGVLYSKDGTKLFYYPYKLLSGIIEIPSSVTSIADIDNFRKLYDDEDDWQVFVGDNVTDINYSNDYASGTNNNPDRLWTPKDSALYKFAKYNNFSKMHYCSEENFIAIQNSKYAFRLDEDVLVFGGFKEPTDVVDYVMPSHLNDLSVTVLDGAFKNVNLYILQSVTIPETIEKIHDTQSIRENDYKTLLGLNGISFAYRGEEAKKGKFTVLHNNSSIDIDLSQYENSNARIGGEGWYLEEKSGGKRLTYIPAKTTVYKHYGIAYKEAWRDGPETFSFTPDNFGVNEEIKLPDVPRVGYTFKGWRTWTTSGYGDFMFIKKADINRNLELYGGHVKTSSSGSGGGGSHSGGSGGSGGGGGGSSRSVGTSSSSNRNTAGSWKRDGKGWWFQKKDGSYPKSEWVMNANKWYRFDENGYMQTGWITLNNQKYFTNSDGTMVSNDWSFQDNKWYFFKADGSMQTGWVQWKDQWYYMLPDGSMATNIITPDGYKVGTDGIWKQ